MRKYRGECRGVYYRGSSLTFRRRGRIRVQRCILPQPTKDELDDLTLPVRTVLPNSTKPQVGITGPSPCPSW